MTNLPEIRIRDWWKKQNSRAVTGRRQRLSDTVRASLLESIMDTLLSGRPDNYYIVHESISIMSEYEYTRFDHAH